MACGEACRALIRAISMHEKEILRLSDENQYLLTFIKKQRPEAELVQEKSSNDDDSHLAMIGGEGTTEEDNEEDEDEEQGESGRKMTKPHSKKRKTEGRAPRAVDNAVDATAQNH